MLNRTLEHQFGLRNEGSVAASVNSRTFGTFSSLLSANTVIGDRQLTIFHNHYQVTGWTLAGVCVGKKHKFDVIQSL
jgi:hypothetical protein